MRRDKPSESGDTPKKRVVLGKRTTPITEELRNALTAPPKGITRFTIKLGERKKRAVKKTPTKTARFTIRPPRPRPAQKSPTPRRAERLMRPNPETLPEGPRRRYHTRLNELIEYLRPSKISLLAHKIKNLSLKDIPPAREGETFLLAFGDADDKKRNRYPNPKDIAQQSSDEDEIPRQLYLADLQKKLPGMIKKLGSISVLGLGDYTSDTPKTRKKWEYIDRIASSMAELEKFDSIEGLAMAFINGNHDVRKNGTFEDYRHIFKHTLHNYKEIGDEAFSFQFRKDTALTIICLNKGNKYITHNQKNFCEQTFKEASANGHSVIFANHVSPKQHMYGHGLGNPGEENKYDMHGFRAIQRMAKKYIEDNDRAFYIFHGDNHGNRAYANAVDSNLAGLYHYDQEPYTEEELDGTVPKRKKKQMVTKGYKSGPGVFLARIDKKTGIIKEGYFLDARSNFEKGLPRRQFKLATGRI